MQAKELNLVLQREYLIVEPADARPLIGSDSIRSCCGVFIFHPLRSAVLHWDDNSCHNDLELFIKDYLHHDIALKDCNVTLIGGWKDHMESKKSANFLKQYFENALATLNLTYFLQKKSTGSISQQGFSLVYMDARTGALTAKDDWGSLKAYKIYEGLDPMGRNFNKSFYDLIQLQDDNVENSGAHIYARDSYQTFRETQSTQLCLAARNNNIPRLIQLIDEGMINVNEAPSNAKGWTPLHYACKLSHYEAAFFLMQNGANPFKKNDAGKRAFDFIASDKFEYHQLLITYYWIKLNCQAAARSLTTFSLFSRHHEKQIAADKIAPLQSFLDSLRSPEKLPGIISELISIPSSSEMKLDPELNFIRKFFESMQSSNEASAAVRP